MKRMLQRQGEVGSDGQPLAHKRAQPPRQTARPTSRRTGPLAYLREVRNEMRKVAWPTRLEVRKYAIVVLITLVVIGALIFVLDALFSEAAVFLFK